MNPSPDLAEFIEVIAGDAELQRLLADEKSTEAFASACATLAEKHSLQVTADEVCELLRERTTTWLQRHIL